MGLIGFIVAIISFVVRQTVDVISTGKYTIIEPLIDQGHWGYAWVAGTLYSCFFVAISASMVLFIAPAAVQQLRHRFRLFLTVSQLFAPPPHTHAPCGMLYFVPMPIGC